MTTPDAQIRTSADLIVALGSTLATGMEKHEIDQCGPACQLLARLGVHAVRQAQSIGILVGRMDETVPAYFAEQAGQLVVPGHQVGDTRLMGGRRPMELCLRS